MIKVAVAGAAGRMGKRITTLCLRHKEINLVGAFERKGHEKVGNDIGVIIGEALTGIKLSDDIKELIHKTDVLIDFTTPTSTLHNLKVVAEYNKAIVIGTTGFNNEEYKQIESLTKNVPCVIAPNMSVGINLLLSVLRDIAKIIGEDYDIEIIEAHHRMKKDAPSGTALKMAQVIAESLGRNLEEVAVYSRKGLIGERSKKEIGIQSIRAGDIIGEHTVIFGGIGERIEITHKVSSRDTFAAGAIKAALWIYEKSPGLYDMLDVLNLKRS